MQKKYKSVFTWISFMSLMALFLYARSNLNIQLDEFGSAMTVISSVLVGIGIWNNPNSKDNF